MNDPLLQAETDVSEARSQWMESVANVKARLRPAALKGELVEKAQARAIEIAGDVAETARRRPALTAGVIATATLILLRKPIIGILKRLTKEK